MKKIDKLNAKENSNRGITLIALIITIIILLILAGISIATLTGENGILKKAVQSNEKSQKAQAEEEIKLVLNEWQIEKVSTNPTFEQYLGTKVESNEIDQYQTIENNKIEIDRNNYYIVVDEKGNIIEDIQKTSTKLVIKNETITLENGTTPQEYSQKIGTPLMVNFEASVQGGKIIKIEPELPYRTNGNELEKQFEITYQIEGKEYKKTTTINFSNKYEIEEPKITLSTTDWTNQDVTATINYGNIDEQFTKEISIDGGENYHPYQGTIQIGENTTIKARITKDLLVKESSLAITNIDKLPPNDFEPTVEDTISSTELKINAVATDQLDEQNRCSGIKEYQYYVYQGENLIISSEHVTTNSWNATNLVSGTTYSIVVEAFDYAGNVKKSESLTYEKKEVYTWAVYPVTATTVYYTLTSNMVSSKKFYNTDSTYSSYSIPPVSGANFTFSNKGSVKTIGANKWISYNGSNPSAAVIYYETGSTYSTGTGYYVFTITQKATRPTKTEYVRASNTPSRYVK
ncbi:MAG: hypothetical protein HFJ34_07955, partial [Clostridia bacterium]|nr:hypothetical protein [Clostridia bacterium]